MAFRAARTIFSTATRASLRAGNRTTQQFCRRNMSASSHGPAISSDKPWIIGSGIIFGPLLLYLLSPSARKNRAAHAVHNDAHDFPGHKHHESTASTIEHEPSTTVSMKDDEGTEANATDVIKAAEEIELTLPNVVTTPADAAVPGNTESHAAQAVERSASEPDATADETVEQKGDAGEKTEADQSTEQAVSPKAEK
ncbi:hypothetical protein AMATHDRAFT_48282 [Amanita thiersii Skay4041]|uniref:Uncharacterized protein n=1 Tax=Amanita thiersii Skay4041 TaxID=703135 RepID=A0A2A9NNN3_9AGAR|nr:hypothetical protein AMATHDRAFT_48282 [Amanita thiersii Skay4041]